MNRKEIIMKSLIEYLHFVAKVITSFMFGIGFGVIVGSMIVPLLS